jgi:two-component system response regulator FixJ
VNKAFAALDEHEEQRSHARWAQTQLARLTTREQEVLDGLACGYPNKTIAYDLGISARTVEVYRANAMEKLAVNSFADALRIAFAAGLGSEQHWLETHTLIVQRKQE